MLKKLFCKHRYLLDIMAIDYKVRKKEVWEDVTQYLYCPKCEKYKSFRYWKKSDNELARCLTCVNYTDAEIIDNTCYLYSKGVENNYKQRRKNKNEK